MAIVKNEKKATLESFNDFERTFQEKGLFSINSKVTEPVLLKKELSDFYKSVKIAVVKTIENLEKQYKPVDVLSKDYVITGIKNLNLHKGDLIILGARPSIGKTAFSLSLSNQLTMEQNIPVGYISSGDMNYGEIGQRFISMESGIPYYEIRAGLLKVDDIQNIQDSASTISGVPFYYYDKPNIMFCELELTARMMVEKSEVQLLIIDSFEFLQELVDAKEYEYRFELENLLDNFKKMAKDLNIPVILLMDMPFSEENCQPTLCDFKKYMIIPHKADMVLFLHRDRCKDEGNILSSKLIIAKNEAGACYEITIGFNPKTASFDFERGNE